MLERENTLTPCVHYDYAYTDAPKTFVARSLTKHKRHTAEQEKKTKEMIFESN